ncbi:TetR/AcrR family transcriptional regulator [uncultured Agitococcus sp.]|uniref:TetR/AcrR family transcriptional regulator n=1 Tax=uncultured Agitococcus sp. TaxID=1506599 RepID=UPI002616BFFC|nr:helix-turn-helix domain-containing protein [uncultured Agitococcus sp.]
MARNAMTDADKLLRRADFINAAHQLFREQKILPSVADIAKSAGLAKGTVYLYFKTKEEIFIALLEDDFAKLLQKLSIIIQQLPLNGVKAAEFFC